MDDDRLTPEAQAAIDGKPKAEPAPTPPSYQSADYLRGWRDCYSYLIRCLAGRDTPPR